MDPAVLRSKLSKLGWDESSSRRTQLITGSIGLVMLFIGVVCQWWAGNNISDVSLSTFCETATGDDGVISETDWKNMKAHYYFGDYYTYGNLNLARMTERYFAGSGNALDLDTAIYQEPAMWCKALAKCPQGAVCERNGMSFSGRGLVVTDVGTSKATGVWPGRSISENAGWQMAEGAFADASTRVRCWDKFKVYRDMLKQVMSEPDWWATPAPGQNLAVGKYVRDPASGVKWSDASIDAAAYGFLYSCYGSKGSTGYILGLAPLFSTLACLCAVISMFACCPKSYMSTLARFLALMAFAMILIGFWVISFITISEGFVTEYMWCGVLRSPLTSGNGIYFDGTPCFDVKTDGSEEVNPFLSWSAYMTGVYTSGGIFNLLATIMLLFTIARTIEAEKLKKMTGFAEFNNHVPETWSVRASQSGLQQE